MVLYCLLKKTLYQNFLQSFFELMTQRIKNKIHTYLEMVSISNRLIGPMGRVFANGPGDLGSIPGCVMPKTLKIA